MMVEDPNDPLDQCPLQPSHMIRRSRMAVHLSKCVAANKPGAHMVQCRYDSTHWVEKAFLERHMTSECDKRELFEKFVLQPDTLTNPNPSPLTQKTELPPAEENWDDGPRTTYDPHLKASSEAVLRTVCVVPKSKRKEFRQMEVERFQELAQQGKVGISVSARARPPQEPTPLRQPRVEVSKVIGLGRGIIRQEESKFAEKTVGRAAKSSEIGGMAIAPEIGSATKFPDVEVEQAMSRLQLDEPQSKSNDSESWVTVGRGHHKKKEYQQLRQPEKPSGALGSVVPNRDAIAVSRGRGKVYNT